MLNWRSTCLATILTFATLAVVPRPALGVGGEGILVPLENWTVLSESPPPRQPAVLLIPGLLAGDETMSAIRGALRTVKIPVAMFRYDSQLGVDRVAARLATVLAAEAERLPDRDLILVTHSMGGLVARCVVESPQFRLTQVRSLIMISPPNHGSSLATLDGSLIKELGPLLDGGQWKVLFDGEAIDAFNETVELFLGKARRDLAPDSDLIKRLNAHPRNPQIRYSILAGTAAPIPPLARGLGQLAIGQVIAQNPEAAPQLNQLVAWADREEWIRGLGDGVVSVRSTRLPGVIDHRELPITHRAPSEPLDHAATHRLAAEVIARIPQAK